MHTLCITLFCSLYRQRQFQILQVTRISTHLPLSHFYSILISRYYIDVGAHPNATSPNQAPFVIFASVRAFPNPAWANVKSDEDEDTLDVHWRPKGLSSRFTTNYAYVKMTNWYAYHLLELKLLDYFDYVGKIDSDVSFLAPFPEPNIPGRMAKGKRKAFATQKEWYVNT